MNVYYYYYIKCKYDYYYLSMIYLYYLGIVLTKFHLFIFHINGIVSVEAIKLFGNCEKNFIYYATCVSNFLNDQP